MWWWSEGGAVGGELRRKGQIYVVVESGVSFSYWGSKKDREPSTSTSRVSPHVLVGFLTGL